jgi:hypothetical protein
VRFAVGDLLGSHVGSGIVGRGSVTGSTGTSGGRGHSKRPAACARDVVVRNSKDPPPPRATPSLMDALQMVWYVHVKWYLHFANRGLVLCYKII